MTKIDIDWCERHGRLVWIWRATHKAEAKTAVDNNNNITIRTLSLSALREFMTERTITADRS